MLEPHSGERRDDGFARAQTAAHDLVDQQAAAGDSANESLADDITQRLCETFANLFLFIAGKETEDAIHALAGVDGVQRGVNDVACLAGGEGDLGIGDAVSLMEFVDWAAELFARHPKLQRG